MVLLEWLASKKRISLFSISLLLWFQEIISIFTPRNVTENFEGKAGSKRLCQDVLNRLPFSGKEAQGNSENLGAGVGCGALPESLIKITYFRSNVSLPVVFQT